MLILAIRKQALLATLKIKQNEQSLIDLCPSVCNNVDDSPD